MHGYVQTDPRMPLHYVGPTAPIEGVYFHFTTVHRLRKIVASATLRPSFSFPTQPVAALWTTENPVWEVGAGGISPLQPFSAGMPFTMALAMGGGLGRIAVDVRSVPLTGWDAVQLTQTWSPRWVSAADGKRAAQRWRVSLCPIPASDWLGVDVWSIQRCDWVPQDFPWT